MKESENKVVLVLILVSFISQILDLELLVNTIPFYDLCMGTVMLVQGQSTPVV